MDIGCGRGLRSRIAAACAFSVWMACGFSHAVQAQTATDGAIGGRVLSAAGAPVAGALVVAQELETGLTLEEVSGAKGEFLVTRLPVGEHSVTVEDAGVE